MNENETRKGLRVAIREATRKMAACEVNADDAGMLKYATYIALWAQALKDHAEEYGL